jgi:annexin A7/11
VKGFGTNEKELIRIFSKADPAKVHWIREQYPKAKRGPLISDIKSEVSGYLEQGLVALASGPLIHDCQMLNAAMKG